MYQIEIFYKIIYYMCVCTYIALKCIIYNDYYFVKMIIILFYFFDS